MCPYNTTQNEGQPSSPKGELQHQEVTQFVPRQTWHCVKWLCLVLPSPFSLLYVHEAGEKAAGKSCCRKSSGATEPRDHIKATGLGIPSTASSPVPSSLCGRGIWEESAMLKVNLLYEIRYSRKQNPFSTHHRVVAALKLPPREDVKSLPLT